MASNNLQEPLLENDWRIGLQQDVRERTVNEIIETLKRHIPLSGPEELKKIAVTFEEKMYTIATSQPDYLTRISLNMLTFKKNSQNPKANSNAATSQSMQSQMQNPVQKTGVSNSAALPPLDGKSQGTVPSVPLQNPNVQITFSSNPFAPRDPMMQAWPTNSMFQFQSQSQSGMPDFQLGTNLKPKKKAFTTLKKMHPVQQPQMPSNEGQANSQMQPMMMPNPFSTVPSVSNSRQNMLVGLQSGSSIDHGQGNVLNQTQQVASNSLQQNLVGGSQQNGQSNSKFRQPQQINPVQQIFSNQQQYQMLKQQLLQQHLLRQQQQQQQQLIQQLSQKQSAQQLVGQQQQQTCQKKSAQEQVAPNTLQQNPVGCFQPMTSSIATKDGLTALQSSAKSLQSNSNVLQPHEQQMFSTFQLMQQQQQILQQHVLRQQLFQQQVQQEFHVVQQLMQELSEKQSAQQLVREQEQTSQKKSVQQQTSLKISTQKETSKKQALEETGDIHLGGFIFAVVMVFMVMVIFTL